MGLVERIEQSALELLPRHRVVVLNDAVADRVAQLGDRFETERFGELVVGNDRAGRLDRLGGDDELGVLTGQSLGLVMHRNVTFRVRVSPVVMPMI